MTENEFDETARAWLDDGPTRMSDRALLSALEEIHMTRQRRPLRLAWRATPVSVFAGAAIAAVVLAVGVLALNGGPRQPDGSRVGGPPTPGMTVASSPSPSASSSPALTLNFPDLTTTFVSPRNGFSIKHPRSVALTPAKQLRGFDLDTTDGFDVVDTGFSAVFAGASGRIPEEGFPFLDWASIDEWVDDQIKDYGGCSVPRSQQAEITIDGQSGRVSECPNRIEARVLAGGRLYLFRVTGDRSDARAVFDAFAATIDLTPETAIDYPALPRTFVSPTYGYSFKYIRGLTPATERWDPVNQPLKDRNFDDRFDAVETGLSAYFEAASTQIPDGISVDDWVDDYVTPISAGGCGVPRSQQAEITIDGQSGRVAKCENGIQASVVTGGRLYLFIFSAARTDERAFFDSWIATIDLRPEDATVPSSTASS